MKRSILPVIFCTAISGILSAQTISPAIQTNYNIAVSLKNGAFRFGETAAISYTILNADKVLSVDITNLDFYEVSLGIKPAEKFTNTFLLTIRSYEVSNFLLPAFLVTAVKGTNTNIFYTPRIPVNNENVKSDQKELAPIMEIYDFPDWMWLIWAGIGLAPVAAFFIIRAVLAKRKKAPAKVKPENPYEHARFRLGKLNDDGIASKNPKDYFAGISEIVREFLENVMDFNALEMATTEIRDYLKKSETDDEIQEIVMYILKICDRVKYAKHKASDENISEVYQEALNLIDRVKLVMTQEVSTEEKQ